MPFIDITPVISDRTKVYPGDTRPSREILWKLEEGAPVTLSTLRTSVHMGAHADAPSHYGASGRTIEEQPIELYVGPCAAIKANGKRGGSVGVADLVGDLPETERLLIDTGSFDGVEVWNEDFCGLEPELIELLGKRGVRLVGIDTPSVDTQESKDLPSHAQVFANDMAILEGLVLTHVAAGQYELIALPLPLEGFDGSPVRAILRSFD